MRAEEGELRNGIAELTVVLRPCFADNAWRIDGGGTLDEFVSSLERLQIVQSKLVGKAMREVDRAKYVHKSSVSQAYMDSPLSIGYGATISAPHMHAWCLELFERDMKPGMAVLDVGSGSGYLTACFASMMSELNAEDPGKVIGIDIIPELVEYGESCVSKANPKLLASQGGIVSFLSANGWEGAPKEAPFDFIHVGAAAKTMPKSLVDQLRPGGRMVIPVHVSATSSDQALYLVEKPLDGSEPTIEMLMGVRYVPLVNPL